MRFPPISCSSKSCLGKPMELGFSRCEGEKEKKRIGRVCCFLVFFPGGCFFHQKKLAKNQDTRIWAKPNLSAHWRYPPKKKGVPFPRINRSKTCIILPLPLMPPKSYSLSPSSHTPPHRHIKTKNLPSHHPFPHNGIISPDLRIQCW